MKIDWDTGFEMKFLLYHVPQWDVTGASMANHDFGSFMNILTNPGMQKVAKYVSVFFFLLSSMHTLGQQQ